MRHLESSGCDQSDNALLRSFREWAGLFLRGTSPERYVPGDEEKAAAAREGLVADSNSWLVSCCVVEPVERPH